MKPTDHNTTQQEAEEALDGGRLWVEMSNGKKYVMRRNGKTKTWKTRPGEYSIPYKATFKATGRIDPYSLSCGYFFIGDNE
jgi:hypothetical protein